MGVFLTFSAPTSMPGLQSRIRAILCSTLAALAAACSPDAEHGAPLPQLSATPEFSLGAALDAPPERQLHDVLDFTVLDDGTFWVIDGSETRLIRRFAPDGAFLGTVSRAGDGPGEFRSPFRMSQLDDGRVVMLDAARPDRVQIFDAAGDWLETVALAPGVAVENAGDLALDRRGQLWLPMRPDPTVGVDPVWMRVDLTNPAAPIDTAVGYGVARLRPDAWREPEVRAPYTPSLNVEVGPNGDVWAGWTAEYRVYRMRPRDGAAPDVALELALEGPPEPRVTVPEAERREARAALEAVVADFYGPGTRVPAVPTEKPRLREFILTRGGLLVARPHGPSRRDADEWAEPTLLDLYRIEPAAELDGSGGSAPGARGTAVALGRIELIGEHEVLDAREGRIWTLFRDSLGVESIRSYGWRESELAAAHSATGRVAAHAAR